MSRYPNVHRAVDTPFGKFYVHIDYDLETGRPVGAWISDPLKDKATTITELAEALAIAFNDNIQRLAQEYAYLVEIEDDDEVGQ